MWMALLILFVLFFGIKLAVKGTKQEVKEKHQANAKPTHLPKMPPSSSDYETSLDWESMFLEIDQAIQNGDHDFARNWLQKFAYTTVNADTPQFVRDRFKTLMTAFAKQDPLYRDLMMRIVPIVEAQPGILQTAIYSQLVGFNEEQVRYALYFAHELGDVNRLKKGRSYQILMPGQPVPEALAKKSKSTKDERQTMRAQYAKDRLKQLKDPDLLKSRPYWKYISNATMVEPCHTGWDGLVLRHDDPWWKKHFPPNGPECRCRVVAVRPDEYTGQIAPMD